MRLLLQAGEQRMALIRHVRGGKQCAEELFPCLLKGKWKSEQLKTPILEVIPGRTKAGPCARSWQIRAVSRRHQMTNRLTPFFFKAEVAQDCQPSARFEDAPHLHPGGSRFEPVDGLRYADQVCASIGKPGGFASPGDRRPGRPVVGRAASSSWLCSVPASYPRSVVPSARASATSSGLPKGRTRSRSSRRRKRTRRRKAEASQSPVVAFLLTFFILFPLSQ